MTASKLIASLCLSLVAAKSVCAIEQADLHQQIGTQQSQHQQGQVAIQNPMQSEVQTQYETTTHVPGHHDEMQFQQGQQGQGQMQSKQGEHDEGKDASLINQVMKVITPGEVQLLKQSQPIATSPLAYEVKLNDLWRLGYEEAKHQSTHNKHIVHSLVHQVQSSPKQALKHLGLSRFLNKFQMKHGEQAQPESRDFIEAFNKNNTFVIDAQTMCQQIMWAYQVGGLNALNKQLGTKYIVPYQKASPKQIAKLLAHGQHKHQFGHESKTQFHTMTENEATNVSEMEEMSAFETLGNESFDESLFNSYAIKADE